MQFGTFFHMCRIDHVLMDMERKEGVWWQLVDGLVSGVLGVIAEGNSREEVLEQGVKVMEWLEKMGVREEEGLLGKLRLMARGRRGKKIDVLDK